MTVASLSLIFDRGGFYGPQRIPASDRQAVDAALRCMLAESLGPYAHRIKFQMTDGSVIVAKPRAS